jgi:competence ComEA-like helix-hairpin-helix protein
MMQKMSILLSFFLSLLLFWSPVAVSDGYLLDINTASVEEIAAALDGIGLVKAQAIVDVREQLGGYTELIQLLDAKGIGMATLEAIKDQIMLQ